ncbi:diguanylate phosphodiesterase [Niallia circulans]|jgi:EAL domain-containing protein (putative c-di-GMP-specific phosphodiesterase class I)|uniref:Diguanylate phosphodiesterase n=1 Tax=Niallia circulans TaxID=1397 RepID=A0AA91Z271_NIACI|nr:EAL-associated domain-containing protein [Niallia circulans]PAD84548.1 diguanylate phosphodiesterase [Niallia circulans]UQZ73698.1 diguanylate phosphodiesterase [Niallia circulans]
MDALDILTDLENVIPYFQAIFSADEHRVIGYEVLARYNGQDGAESLGDFFADEGIPDEYKLEVDQVILTKALDKALSLEEDVLLFINRDAEMLMKDDGEAFLDTLLEYEGKGIKLNRIVLELSERNYQGQFDHLDHLLIYYRTYGIKIAIDKMGSDSSYLDRLSDLGPDILKIDLLALRSTSTSHTYQDVLYSLSMLARKIGATLLFENIEMVYQLQFAWKNGGRFYQGYYLHYPEENFVERNSRKETLRNMFHEFILSEKKKLATIYDLTEEFQGQLQALLVKYKKYSSYEELLKLLSAELTEAAFRMYVCDEDGFQKSANIIKYENDWLIQPEYAHKNWSWRPYFLENIMKMRNEKKGILSDLYSDIETGETVRTYSYPLNSKEYLFIDLSYNYLDRMKLLLP